MLYDAYEVQRSLLAGASRFASMGAGWLNNPANPLSYGSMGPIAAASLDVFAHASASRGKPEFGLHEAKVGKKTVAVHEEILARKPFASKTLRKQGIGQPKRDRRADVRPTMPAAARLVERMLPADVFITDWRDAKLVPLSGASTAISTI
jgi:poly(3-hydroxybutyrate) depolymerase